MLLLNLGKENIYLVLCLVLEGAVPEDEQPHSLALQQLPAVPGVKQLAEQPQYTM